VEYVDFASFVDSLHLDLQSGTDIPVACCSGGGCCFKIALEIGTFSFVRQVPCACFPGLWLCPVGFESLETCDSTIGV
jgi:hypothetical protein